MNIDNKLSSVYKLSVNITQKLCSFKLQAFLVLNFLLEPSKTVFNMSNV